MENNNKVLIGRTTFGIALILFGITLVIQTFCSVDILRYILALWPLIIISIGVELIYYSNKKDITTKYDFLGIILTGIIVVSGIGFSILNYGINKIFYSNDIQEYLNNDRVNNYFMTFDSKTEIINLNDFPIGCKIVESGNTGDSVKISILYKVNGLKNINIIELLNKETLYINNYLYSYNGENGYKVLEFPPLPEYFKDIELMVITDSKDNVKLTGEFTER